MLLKYVNPTCAHPSLLVQYIHSKLGPLPLVVLSLLLVLLTELLAPATTTTFSTIHCYFNFALTTTTLQRCAKAEVVGRAEVKVVVNREKVVVVIGAKSTDRSMCSSESTTSGRGSNFE